MGLTNPLLYLLLIPLLLFFISKPLLLKNAKRLGLQRTNFLGNPVTLGYGMTIWLLCMVLFGTMVWLIDEAPGYLLLLIITGWYGLLGTIDDLFGKRDGEPKGLKGHFSALFKGRITTGLIKAVGGVLGAVWLGGITAQHTWQWPVNTLLIALSANAINLFDLRPGRAITISLVAISVCLVLAFLAGQYFLFIGLVLIWSMCFFWRKEDAQAKAMMGDSGSNLLGAVMGVSLAVCLPAWASVSWLVVLVLLHVAAERVSFSQVIERTPWLARIDALTGLRKPVRKTTR
ncbi:MAG: hypothetical protein ACYC1M_05735 [Armatimonadota bacterium]